MAQFIFTLNQPAVENLTGSPPDLVIVAEYDPIRDEGIAYAVLLEKAGVKVTPRIYKQMPQGFFQMGGYIDEGKNAIKGTANAIKDILKT
jgi:acetyl esterase